MAPPAHKWKKIGCPNELHRENTMDNNASHYHSQWQQPNKRGSFPPNSQSHQQANNRANNRGSFPPNSHSHQQPNNRGSFPPNSHSHQQPNNRGSFPPKSHSHQQPNNRGSFPPNSHSRPHFKLSNQKWKRKKTKFNKRDGQMVYAEERSSNLHPPPAPHNTTSFLTRAWNNGGIAFDSPHNYFPISPPNYPNPSPHYSPISPPNNPNPSPHYSPISPPNNPNPRNNGGIALDSPHDFTPISPPNNPNPSPHDSRGSEWTFYSLTSPPNNPNPSPHDSRGPEWTGFYSRTSPIYYSIESPQLPNDNNLMEANGKMSPGSLRRSLEEANTRMNIRLGSMEIAVQDASRRLDLLESIHTDHASRNINTNQEAVESSSSEISIGN